MNCIFERVLTDYIAQNRKNFVRSVETITLLGMPIINYNVDADCKLTRYESNNILLKRSGIIFLSKSAGNYASYSILAIV